MIKKRLSDEKPRLLRRFLEWSIFYGVVFVKTFTVFLDADIQYKVSIFQRLIVNQPVQRCAVKAVVGNLVLHGDIIDKDSLLISEKLWQLTPKQLQLIESLIDTYTSFCDQ